MATPHTSPQASLSEAVRRLHAGDVGRAEQLCRELLSKNSKLHQAAAVLGQIATMRGRHAEALKLLKSCVSQAPREIDYLLLLAEALASAGHHTEALARYDKALKLRPDHPPALAGKANVLARTRDWSAARAVLEPRVAAGTEDAGMAIVYARIARHKRDFDAAAAVALRHARGGAAPEIRRSLFFEIGRAREAAGDYDGAFEAFSEGNRLTPGSWRPAAASERYDRIMAVFGRELLAALPRPAGTSELPVFIVGIPRCGSTLVEQIIDAHPEAHGAGEILLLPEIIAGMGARIGSTLEYPQCAADLDAGDVAQLAAAYLEPLEALAPAARRVCDKYLINYEHLGLIQVLLPAARVIHCRRDPLDTCLSCFAHKFAPGTPAYTADLRHLGFMYNDYRALMEHWREMLDLSMLEVDYEDLVADQEAVSRRIIDFCGLPWDDACLRFWESGREVLTLSREQVARPIYRTAAGRHRRYGAHLDPLREVLASGARGRDAAGA